MHNMTVGEIFKARKVEKKENRLLATVGAIMFVMMTWFLYQGATLYTGLPLVQKDQKGKCVRVLDSKGDVIQNGCKTVLANKNMLYKSEFIAKQ